jgi:uncharacterized membrane protein
MNVVLWIVASVLAVAFLGAGIMKVLRTREQLKSSGMAWVDDFSPAAVKAIGALEILGALGLVLPALLDIAPILVPVAAVVVHARRHEINTAAPSIVLLVLSAFVAWGRFGPYNF